MGCGNVCTLGQHEGLFFIDNDDFHVYRRDDPYDEEPETRLQRDLDYGELTGDDWYFDEIGTEEEQDDIESCFKQSFMSMFPSFRECQNDQWLKGNSGHFTRRAILENSLFYICIEDNQWSVAVELVQKEEPWDLPWMQALQSRFRDKYMDGMKKCLLDRLPSIGTYTGAWTSGILRREDLQ